MRTIRWGIIGAGSVTEVKSGPGFQQADHSQLVAVMRRNGDLARDYALRHGVPRWYDRADDLIGDPAVDAVYIATPPAWHLPFTLQCAGAGKPVYVEKPMALNAAECDAMLAACAAAGVPLFVAYYRRALARFVRIKALVEAGAIGELRWVSLSLHRPLFPAERDPQTRPWRVIPAIAGGGHFIDLGAHMLDLVDWICGPIQQVAGFAANQARAYAAEDLVSATFRCAGGAYGLGIWCFSSFERQDWTELVGSAGKIGFATFSPGPVRLTTAAGTQELLIADSPHVQQPLIQTIVDALNGVGACPSTGETAARTTRVMDQLVAGYYRAAGPGD